MLPLLETSAGKQVTLALTVESDIPAVQADLTQLRQIIMNLVINAAEAMSPTGGTVAIGIGSRDYDRAALASAWAATELPAGRYVYLEVRDGGCGMSQQTQQRIFDPFFTTKFTGRGLGLAAVLGIVRGHHGAIVVNSAPGQGATFTVLFPPARAVANAIAPAPAATPVWRGSGTVLVVDDEEIARETTAAMLGMIGFNAVAAADGREALERVGSDTAFAAIILDLTMPGQNGLEVHGELRRRAPTLPVVLMSGYTAHDARAVAGNGSSTAFLQKPFRLTDLATALRCLIEPASRG
jgi:CheY-like chemotaxis protein